MKRPRYDELARLILNSLDELYGPDEQVAPLAKERVRHVMAELCQQVLYLIERKQ